MTAQAARDFFCGVLLRGWSEWPRCAVSMPKTKLTTPATAFAADIAGRRWFLAGLCRKASEMQAKLLIPVKTAAAADFLRVCGCQNNRSLPSGRLRAQDGIGLRRMPTKLQTALACPCRLPQGSILRPQTTPQQTRTYWVRLAYRGLPRNTARHPHRPRTDKLDARSPDRRCTCSHKWHTRLAGLPDSLLDLRHTQLASGTQLCCSTCFFKQHTCPAGLPDDPVGLGARRTRFRRLFRPPRVAVSLGN